MKIFTQADRAGGRARRAGRRALTTAPESLEARQLMAAGPLGIDVAPTLNYVDAMKEAQGWTTPAGGAVATDVNGWPLADAQVVALDERVNQSYNGPDPNATQPDIGGTYHLSFQGSAVIKPGYFQNFAVQNQKYDVASNTTTADLVVYGNLQPNLTLVFTRTANPASSSGAGVANVKLIRPGYDPNTAQVFTNEEVNDIAPFSTLRYLNVDGANGNYPLYNTTYQTTATSSFVVAAGSHTITFQGLNAVGDATAYVDNVKVVADGTTPSPGGTGPVAAPAVPDGGFEAVQVGANNFVYDPTGSPWTFAASAGLAANNSGINASNPAAPEGSQVAFLQNQGSASQAVGGFAAGSYHITFATMQRDGYAPQAIQVLVDGKVVETISPPAGNLVTLDWSQRKLPTASSQVAGPGAPGESWEYMIALANATNTDMWINIPGPATNDYIARLATLIKNGDTVGGVTYAGLKPNLKVYIESSNEVWGGIYPNLLYNAEAAQLAVRAGDTALTAGGVNDVYTMAQRYELERTMQATTIFQNVLGADPTFSKIRPILGSEETSYNYFAGLLPWFEQAFGAPSRYFYGIGGANYDNPTDYSSVDNLFASLVANLPQRYATTQSFTTIANYYGLQNIAYEGGVNTAGSNTAAGQQVSLAASRDPRMESFVQQLYDTWFAAGGNLAEAFDGPFDIVGPSNQFGLAEVAQASNPSLSAKYRAFVDMAQAAPQAVTAGTAISATAPTQLSLAADSMGNGFATPAAGQSNDWLINVAAAGNYDLVIRTAGGINGGRITVATGDQSVIGTYTLGASGTYDLARLALHAGLNTVAISTLAPFGVASLSLNPPSSGLTSAIPPVNDAGFEDDPQAGVGRGYAYNPAGTAWTFAGPSGLTANNTLFTAGNPATPDGQQVAFIQNQGAISQAVNVNAAGTYSIGFLAAQRGNWGSAQTVQVLVDGSVVGSFTPNSTSYQALATPAFKLTAGMHAIKLQGITSSGGDATAFVDGVSLVQTAPATVLVDAGFEDDPQAGVGRGYAYNPAGTAWTFAGPSGLTANNTLFTAGNPATPDGQQVAFIQNQGAISQATGFAAGTYTIGFLAALRGNWGSAQTIRVLVDGTAVASFTPGSVAYQAYATPSFAVAAGLHTITFQGLASSSGDATDFIDDVTLNQATITPGTVRVGARGATTPTGTGGATAALAVPLPPNPATPDLAVTTGPADAGAYSWKRGDGAARPVRRWSRAITA